jgi:DeoR family transcriptional regulator, fructose operon transcriptional repressor
MTAKERLEQIVALVNERGYLSVGELSRIHQVSEMTIRRDLDRLEKENRLRRTFGGAASLISPTADGDESQAALRPDTALVDRVDVLVTTSVNPKYDNRLLESLVKKRIPIIAESLTVHNEETVVAADNYQAALELGRMAGEYACRHWNNKAYALDLTYSLSNTQARSRGFTAGLREALPEAEIVLSINAQSRYATAYQLTRDALAVHTKINIIFAINDTTAWAAIQACRDLNIDPERVLVFPFGLEGDTLKDALMRGDYCKIGLAMFPEIVGPVCLEAAIAAYNHVPLPRELVTPSIILTSETLPDFYTRRETGWELRWEAVHAHFQVPLETSPLRPRPQGRLPRRIGFIIPFSEHEWYRKLFTSMQAYAAQLAIGFEVIDAEQNLKDEVEMRRRVIARVAAEQVQPGDVVLIDGGPIANHLAEALMAHKDITVITDSMAVFNILKNNQAIVLILTGGAYRHSSQMLVGPTAEGALRELRGDKLFLMVAGISLNYGLWHTNISEVTMKQAMIRSAREVILLADHTSFGQESVVQVAPLSVVSRLITDDALPASTRLDLTKLGIQIILANE